jgi:hypothetical protein
VPNAHTMTQAEMCEKMERKWSRSESTEQIHSVELVEISVLNYDYITKQIKPRFE